jgi:hypothetical protein
MPEQRVNDGRKVMGFRWCSCRMKLYYKKVSMT